MWSATLSKIRNSDWKAVGRFLIAFSPAIALTVLVSINAVNIPVWDGWERAALFEKFDAGTLTFADLYAPHIDHRMVFPRLLWLGLGYASDGDLRFEVVATLLVGIAAGIGFWKLARQTLGAGGWTTGLAFLANLWIFSPLQYDNWLWPIQTSFMIPMTCLIWSIWAVLQPWTTWKRWLLAALLAIIGTHSFSHGLFIWPAVFVLVLCAWKNSRAKWIFTGTWLALASVIIGCYFGINFKTATNYSYGRSIGDPPPIADDWQENLTDNFGKSRRFFFRMIGAPLIRQFPVDPLPRAKIAGILCLLTYAAFGIFALIVLLRNRDHERWRKMLPWLALGGAVIAISLGVGTGRASLLAEARATVPRLTSVANYLPLSFLVLVALCRRNWLGSGTVAFLIALQIHPWIYGKKLMDLWLVSRTQAQAQTMFIEHFDPEPSRILAYSPGIVKHYAPVLNEKDWLDHHLVKSLNITQFRVSDELLPHSKGEMLDARLEGDRTELELKGTSCLHNPDRPFDAVLITAQWGKHPPKIIGMADSDGTLLPTRYRIDLQFTALWELSANAPGTWMRWTETIPINTLPRKEGPVKIQAWAFKLENKKVYPMPNHVIFEDGKKRFVRE